MTGLYLTFGRTVGCGDHNNTLIEQLLEQQLQNHSVADVCDLKLVET